MSDRPKFDGRGVVSRHAQERWSQDRHVREVGFLVMQLGDRRDIHVFGGLVIHDGACEHPDGPCTCEGGPLTIVPRPPRAV